MFLVFLLKGPGHTFRISNASYINNVFYSPIIYIYIYIYKQVKHLRCDFLQRYGCLCLKVYILFIIFTAENEPQKYKTFLASRPDVWEVEAINRVCKLCLEYEYVWRCLIKNYSMSLRLMNPCNRTFSVADRHRVFHLENRVFTFVILMNFIFSVPCHIVHLSAADALPIIQKAKEAGAKLTTETTHHYLTLNAEDVPDGATEYKCCPPIRSQENQVIFSANKNFVVCENYVISLTLLFN